MRDSDAGPPRPASRRRVRIVWIVAAILGAWLLLAYLVLPLAWRHYEHEPGLAEVPMVKSSVRPIWS